MGLQVVVGGQFGSEAKGAATAAICFREAEHKQVTVVRVGGPNAGHSAADGTGRVWALRQVPAGMVADPSVRGVIASGSEIDPEVLQAEIAALQAAGHHIADRLIISDAATIITDDHKKREEGLVGLIGSTGKGIGAARAQRLMRHAETVAGARNREPFKSLTVLRGEYLERDLNTRSRWTTDTVVLEGTQGYGLGLHTRFYPQVTSGDCRAVDVCAQAGINPWGTQDLEVHVVIRPNPIRVAGNSGPLLGETTWDDLGLPVEHTTVTRKPRRVGAYDPDLVDAALAANGPNAILAVSMLDKVPGAVKDGEITEAGPEFLNKLSAAHDADVRWVGIGPLLSDWIYT